MSFLAQKSEFESQNPSALDQTALLFYIQFSRILQPRSTLSVNRLCGAHSLPEGLWALSLLGIQRWPHGLLLGISAQTRIHGKEITTSKALYFPSCNPYRNNPDLFSQVCILLSRDSVKHYSWQRSRRKDNVTDRHWIFGVCQEGWQLMEMLG